ncbi:MAG TPA: hypothetical protein VF997_11280 [Polyangia bacterium]
MTIEPGDLILVKSAGIVFGLARRISGNAFDHVAVVASDGSTINIDKPGARLLPAERLLRPSLHPLVLRPRFADAAERVAFVRDIERLVRAPYDVRRTLDLVVSVLLRRFAGVTRRLPPLGWERERWICTDAVLLGLERNAAGFRGLRMMPLDWVALASGTTNDLLEISRLRPDLLAPVAD